MEVIEAFLARSRETLQLVALTETVQIDANRNTASRSTDEVVLALADGVTSRYVFYDPLGDPVDLEKFHLTETQNCIVLRDLQDPDGTAKLFELGLDRTLAEGDTQILRYVANFDAARDTETPMGSPEGEAIVGFLTSPASYVLEVQFDKNALPLDCRQVFQARPTGPVQTVRPLVLTSEHAVHIALAQPQPGGHGIAWKWG